MSLTLRRLLRLAAMPRRRLALSVALTAATILFGVGLIATSGYLISRAAEQPPILSLTTTIVVVRFFGLARPLARYLDRLLSHDLALRSLAQIRSRFYARIEPLAPAQLEGFRRGDLVSRMVGDVDALQGLYLRGVGPPAAAIAVALVAVASRGSDPSRGRSHPRSRTPARRTRSAAALRAAFPIDGRPAGARAGRADGRPRRGARGRARARALRP